MKANHFGVLRLSLGAPFTLRQKRTLDSFNAIARTRVDDLVQIITNPNTSPDDRSNASREMVGIFGDAVSTGAKTAEEVQVWAAKVSDDIQEANVLRVIREDPERAIRGLNSGKLPIRDATRKERLINNAQREAENRLRREERADRSAERALKEERRLNDKEATDLYVAGKLTYEKLDLIELEPTAYRHWKILLRKEELGGGLHRGLPRSRAHRRGLRRTAPTPYRA